MHQTHDSLTALTLDNRFGQLPDAYFRRVAPTPVPEPWLVCASADAAALLDLSPQALHGPETLAVLAGNSLLPGTDPLATVYAGHQFGHYVPQLGDGRAHLLAQARNQRNETWDIQLKGSGPTPFSRHADGRAVLRSTIREFVASEAMHHLGVATTRALCVVGSSLPVQRETLETAAVLTRLAPSHVRFGHFEYFFYREDYDRLAPLADSVILDHFPELAGDPQRFHRWLEAVTDRTAAMIAQWQGLGFVHGVMNTDNMSVLGLTIDYGPYAFMETFNPQYAPNHTDQAGRYAYDQQPLVGQWNLSRLLQACLPLLDKKPEKAVKKAELMLERYRRAHQSTYRSLMLKKLGLADHCRENHDLAQDLFSAMAAGQADFTNTFRGLCAIGNGLGAGDAGVLDAFVDRGQAAQWLVHYRERLALENSDEVSRQAAMRRQNPCYVPRTHLLQTAIGQAEQGDGSAAQRLLDCLTRPYEEQAGCEDLARPGTGTEAMELSCSS